MAEFRPLNIGNAFFQGQDQARQNALGDQAIEQNAIQMDQSRENAMTRRQQLSDEQKKQFAGMMVQASQHALQQQNPKAFIEQNFPQLAQLAGPQWATADDATVRQKLQEAIGKFGPVAGIGPAQPKEKALINTVGPDGKPVRGEDVIGASVYEKPEGAPYTFRAMRPDEIKAYGLPSGTAAQINEKTGQINVLPGTAGGNISEGERGAANYFGRMSESEKLLTDYVPSTPEYMAAKKLMGGGAITSSIANAYLSPDQQAYYQAASDWVRAKLRKESGAAIGVDEMENEIKTYFPVPGDSPKVVAQKKQARMQATQGMRRMGGRASAEYEQDATQTPSAGNDRLTPEQAAQLPPGTQFIGMDGVPRVKR